jgi:hypothetical protein
MSSKLPIRDSSMHTELRVLNLAAKQEEQGVSSYEGSPKTKCVVENAVIQGI